MRQALAKLPNGSVLKYRRAIFVLMDGVEARIVTNVNTGLWQFAHNTGWKTFKVVFNPNVKAKAKS